MLMMYQNNYNGWLCPPENDYIPAYRVLYNKNSTKYPAYPYPILLLNELKDPKFTKVSWTGVEGDPNQVINNSIYRCSANPYPPNGVWNPNYAMNHSMWAVVAAPENYGHHPAWTTQDKVQDPSKVIYLMDTDRSYGGSTSTNYYTNRIGPYANLLTHGWGLWHKNAANILYFDGHVGPANSAQLTSYTMEYFKQFNNSTMFNAWYTKE
jgi:prepilin-type processing-associated H-X9-DG protein